jgi:hypothetical protein
MSDKPDGYYYLHSNGELIYKAGHYTSIQDFMESDLVVAYWPVDTEDRETAWTVVVEALAAGANLSRVIEVADRLGCTDEDAHEFADRASVKLFKDGEMWCATRDDFVDLGESPAGFGHQAFEAFADLAKTLGFRSSKGGFGRTFAQVVTQPLQDTDGKPRDTDG